MGGNRSRKSNEPACGFAWSEPGYVLTAPCRCIASALVVAEKEQFVLNNRPASRGPELVLSEFPFFFVVGVELQPLIHDDASNLSLRKNSHCTAVETDWCRTSRLHSRQPRPPAELSAEITGLNFELLDRVGRRQVRRMPRHSGNQPFVVIIDPIQNVIVVDCGQAIGHETTGLVQHRDSDSTSLRPPLVALRKV